MSYTSLISRTWIAVWRNPHIPIIYVGALLISDVISFLIGLGLLVPIFEAILNLQPELRDALPTWAIPNPIISVEQLGEGIAWVNSFGIAGWIGAGISLLVIVILAGCFYLTAFGGVIASSAEVMRGRQSSPGRFLKAGLRRLWSVLILASFTAIPYTAIAILVVVTATVMIQGMGGLAVMQSDSQALSVVVLTITCVGGILFLIAGLITTVLSLWVPLAYRATILENHSPIPAMRRAWQVIRANVGNLFVLLVITLAIGVGLGVLLSIPNQLALIFRPIRWVTLAISGLWQSFVIVLWTAAWLEMTTTPERAQ